MKRSYAFAGPRAGLVAACLTGGAFLAGCEPPTDAPTETTADRLIGDTAAAPEDALADGFALFNKLFVTTLGFDQTFPIGFGFNPALSTRRILDASGNSPKGSATIVFNSSSVTATLGFIPPGQSFDLYLVKNKPGVGTVKPEAGDTFLQLGTFQGSSETSATLTPAKGLVLNGAFDFDLIVVTEAGKVPSDSVIATGQFTLFEKRLFRSRSAPTNTPATKPVLDADAVETTDQQVVRGAHLFFEETFGGNGRTCGTCHPPQHNLTIDPDFIKTLPAGDPLFVAENNPALKDLEDGKLLRSRAVIRENTDGFEDPTRNFVERGVPHTFALNTSNAILHAGDGSPFSPPDQRLGWGGDGSPGRGTLNEFPLGAIVQHFTRTLARKPGVDFQLPTQEDLDAMEAFSLFTGRHTLVDLQRVEFADASAQTGSTLFFGFGCNGCHSDMEGFDNSVSMEDLTLDTGVANLPESKALPPDDGFGHERRFNVPVLVEAADSPPFFHNNARPTIEKAVEFYTTPEFNNSPDGGQAGFSFPFNPTQISQVADFLRVINAAENIRQVKKRALFVHDHRTTTNDNTSLLVMAIADTQDAIGDLTTKSLNAKAVSALNAARKSLVSARDAADASRPTPLGVALKNLDSARAALFSANPDNQF